jgi:hypothetical protein
LDKGEGDIQVPNGGHMREEAVQGPVRVDGEGSAARDMLGIRQPAAWGTRERTAEHLELQSGSPGPISMHQVIWVDDAWLRAKGVSMGTGACVKKLASWPPAASSQ